jgi:hypothetical protein
MKSKKKKEKTPMEKITQNYEKFIKDKEVNENGKELFDKALKKAINKKKNKKQ